VKAKNIIWLFIIFVILYSCDSQKTDDKAFLNGTVYSQTTEGAVSPLEGVLVTARGYYTQSYTDVNGGYEITIELEAEEEAVTIQASKAGYSYIQADVTAKKDETTIVPDITLTQTFSDTAGSPTDTITTSGDAAHVEIYGNHESHIYIQSAGLQEAAAISFLVTDAKGVPVDDDHKVTVNFSILNGPDGGEYLFPEEMETVDGRVFTILNSGTIAGAVQILASFIIEGQTIRAIPIRIAIYGGLPDNEHFSVGLEKVNIAGQVHSGLIDRVTAFVGDKYSNPVAPGTAVYFNSDFCIIEGSAVTDELGRAVVRFMSASPLPPNPPVNPFAHIQAFTYSDTLAQHEISASSYLLLSGPTAALQVNPVSFQYNNSNTAVSFNYTVSDVWGYPLVGSTSINVTASDGTLYGDTNLKLVDTQSSGPGTTDFGFVWAPGDSLEANQVFISIVVKPPDYGNGYRSTRVGGTKVAD